MLGWYEGYIHLQCKWKGGNSYTQEVTFEQYWMEEG